MKYPSEPKAETRHACLLLPLWLSLILPMVSTGHQAQAQLICDPSWTAAYKCMEHCGPCPGSGNGGTGYVNWARWRAIQQQQAIIAAAQARYEQAKKDEEEAEAKKLADAAAAVARAEAARQEFIRQRNLLASMMRSDDSSDAGMRSDDSEATGMRCDDSTCGSASGDGLRDDTPGAYKPGTAMDQLRDADISESNAACIMDGMAKCLRPVSRAIVLTPQGEPSSIPADAAEFVKRIPKSEMAKPEVKGWVDQYVHYAQIRGDDHDQMVRDEVALKKDPQNQDKKLKVMEDSGNLTGAVKDENTTKDTILHMGIPLLPVSQDKSTATTSTGKTSNTGGATQTTNSGSSQNR